tara:strand:+ start:3280 stop:3654 length:375 start_codon:yes stop_codon:yes gene_type:complete
MECVYVVRHHFTIEKKVENSEDFKKESGVASLTEDADERLTVTEWVFKSFDSAFNHSVNLSLSLMGIDRHGLKDVDEVRMFKHVYQIFEFEEDKPYKAIKVPCDGGKEELEEDLIEFHRMELLD